MGDNTCDIPLHTKGCEDTLKDFVSKNVLLVAGVAIGVGIFQVSTLVWFISIYSINIIKLTQFIDLFNIFVSFNF